MKRELKDARELMAKMASSTEKLNHMLSVGKSPYDKRGFGFEGDKRGLGFEDDKEIPTPNKTMFVKSLGNKEASPMQTPRKKINLGQYSHSAQVKVV